MGKKILLIDDDADLGRLVESILRPMDLTVYQSYTGLEGLRKCYEIHPDLVILDIMMPDLNGFDVCARLREMSSVPVLMLTARTTENDMLRGFTVGVDDFVKKPFNKNEFEARVRALLRRSTHRTANPTAHILSYKDAFLEIDLNAQVVKLNNKILDLSPGNTACWRIWCENRGRSFPKGNWCVKSGGNQPPSAYPTHRYMFSIFAKNWKMENTGTSIFTPSGGADIGSNREKNPKSHLFQNRRTPKEE
ncbi:MAG: DNA-binding response regulator [Chloroflexi bacterium]|nr:MAG: DNA-binding response regulator [Chloroflexota bacterium]